MGKKLKRVSLIIFGVFVMIALTILSFEMWLSKNLQTLLNYNPERAYNLTYDDMDLFLITKGLKLENLKIEPLNKKGATIEGQVELAEINNINWKEFIQKRSIDISEVIFVNPDFKFYLKKGSTQFTDSSKDGNNIQKLFSDIFSRGNIHNFSLSRGRVHVYQVLDSNRLLGRVSNINFKAIDIESDSIQLKYLIPFNMKSFSSSFDSLFFHLNDDTDIKTGKFYYDTEASILTLQNVSMYFNDHWLNVSKKLGTQVDLIELDLKNLQINNFDANSSIYNMDVRAQSVVLDSLVLRDHRDKNMPRPPDEEKRMFEGMIQAINFPLKVDSILIKNSHISYTELGENKPNPGTIKFCKLYGSIYNLTTLPQYQEQFKMIEADIIAAVNENGKLSMRLEIPYDQSGFNIKAILDTIPAEALNETLLPLADIETKAGTINHLEINMNANPVSSSNNLIFIYQDLQIEVYKEGEEETQKKDAFLSKMANLAMKSHNLPDDKNYRTVVYQTNRNIYRGPFNFMWLSVKDGITQILPTGMTLSLMEKSQKKDKKKESKEDKK